MFGRVLTRFAARFFACPFFMLISFNFSYLENCSVVFYLSFFLHLATGRIGSLISCFNFYWGNRLYCFQSSLFGYAKRIYHGLLFREGCRLCRFKILAY